MTNSWWTNLRGDQLELPGTNKDPAGLARLKAAAPLKPTQPQEPCDEGLFSDESKQKEMKL